MQTGFTTDPPVIVGIAACNSVSRSLTPDQQSTLIGCFDELNLPSFPHIFQFAIVTWITSVVDEFQLAVKVVRPMDDLTEEIRDFGPSMAIAKTKPGGVTMAVTITAIPFTGPGRHEVRVLGNNALLGQRPLLVNQIILPNPFQGGQPQQ